jgi:hypothetical protein
MGRKNKSSFNQFFTGNTSNNKKRLAILCLIIGSLANNLAGQNVRKYTNDFLTIGAGARAFAMSGAVVSITEDATASYWNPASLVKVKDNLQATFMHAEYFGGIANYDYGSIAFGSNKKSGYAISFIRMGVDGILNTINLIENGEINYSRVSSFSAVDFALIGSMGQSIKLRGYRHLKMSYGVNTKIIRRRGGQFAKAWGFGIDASIQLDNKKNGLGFGATLFDATSTFTGWSFDMDALSTGGNKDYAREVFAVTGNDIPVNSLEIALPRLLTGISKTLKKDAFTFKAEMSAEITFDGRRNTLIKTGLFSIGPRTGFEGTYEFSERNALSLRGGIGNYQRILNASGDKNRLYLLPSAGVGLKLNKFTLDYAIANFAGGGTVLFSNVFSIRFNINPEE